MKRKKIDSSNFLESKPELPKKIKPVGKQVRWNLLPRVLWELSFDFLSYSQMRRMPLVSKLFLDLSMEWTREAYYGEFPAFDKLDPIEFKKFSLTAQFQLFREISQDFSKFDDLFDQSYTPLFYFLSIKDEESAIRFIQLKLKQAANTKENVTDRVFILKFQGKTAINMANILGLKKFLNFCFDSLILNGNLLNKKYSLIKTHQLEQVLDDLNTHMSMAALWMYGTANSCDRMDICDALAQKDAWDKWWWAHGEEEEESEDHSTTLLMVASFLGNENLVKYVLQGITPKELKFQMHLTIHFKKHELYDNYAEVKATPLSIAILSQNHQLIHSLWLPTTRTLDDKAATRMEFNLVHLAAFYIEYKDNEGLLSWLQLSTKNNWLTSNIFIEPISIDPEYFGLPLKRRYNLLDLALAKGWEQGIRCLFSTATDLINRGDTKILYYIFSQAKLKIFKSLVNDHNLSLTIKYPYPQSLPGNRFHYPLRSALVLEDEDDEHSLIADFITKKIGNLCAIQQLSEEIKSVTPNMEHYDPSANKDLQSWIDELTEQMSESSDKVEQNSSASSSHFSLFTTPSQDQGATSEQPSPASSSFLK